MDNLSGFDPSTMTYLATQMGHPNPNIGGNADLFQDMLLPVDMADHPASPYGFAGYVIPRSSVSTNTDVRHAEATI